MSENSTIYNTTYDIIGPYSLAKWGGTTLDMNQSGNTIVFGSLNPNEGNSWSPNLTIVSWNGTSWIQKGNTIETGANTATFSIRGGINASGSRVALSMDAVVTDNTTNGVVQIYDFDSTVEEWNLIGTIIGTNDSFGSTFDLNGDGTRIAVGDAIQNQVSIYEYSDSMFQWNILGDTIRGANNTNFGQQVSLNEAGNVVSIVIPNEDATLANDVNGTISVYQYDTNTWSLRGDNLTETDETTYYTYTAYLDDSGTRLALSAGNPLTREIVPVLPGTPNPDAFLKVYEWNGSNWNQLGNAITEPSGTIDQLDMFAFSSDGTHIICSIMDGIPFAPKELLRVYEYTGGDWQAKGEVIENGFVLSDHGAIQSVALNENGTLIAYGMPLYENGLGLVRAFQWEERWQQNLTLPATIYPEPTPVIRLECLDGNSTVIVNTTYVFNGNTTYDPNVRYGLTNGTYILIDVPESQPIAILNSTSQLIQYTGEFSGNTTTIEGNSYIFYTGNVSVNVSGNFGVVSVISEQGFFMENVFVFSGTCPPPPERPMIPDPGPTPTPSSVNLTTSYYIKRTNDDVDINTTVQLPYIQLEQNDTVQFIDSLPFYINSPFDYDETSNVKIYATRSFQSFPVLVTDSASPTITYKDGTILLQHNKASGQTLTEYPIYYSVILSEHTTAFMRLNIIIENDASILSVLDRLQYQTANKQILKTEANRLLYERFEPITPALLRFHTMEFQYHSSTPTQNDIIRLDREWSLRSGRYTTLIESTNAASDFQQQEIKLVLPQNAPVDQVFPVVLYRRQNERIPELHIGTASETGVFSTTQTFQTKKFLSPHLPVFEIDSVSYYVDVKGLQYDVASETWRLIARVPQQRLSLQHLVMKKDGHVQKHFMANDDELVLTYNGVQLQALSLRGGQIKFITATLYRSLNITNVDNTQRLMPARYYSLNRDTVVHSMTGQELFEDQFGSGDCLRQTNITTLQDTTLTVGELNYPVVSAFGNTTVNFGANAYVFSSKQEWTQEVPFVWTDWIQSDQNLPQYSPNSGLPNTTQVMSMSYILNLRVNQTSTFSDTIDLMSTTYRIPNHSILLRFQVIDNATGGVDIVSNLQHPTTTETSIQTIAEAIPVNQWNRIGMDVALVFHKSLTTWTLLHIYARTAVYLIPDDIVLDGTTRPLLQTKVYPTSSDVYEEHLISSFSGSGLSSLGSLNVEDTSVFTRVGNKTNPDITENATIFLDELEIFVERPILSNIYGGSILTNLYY